MAAVTPEEPSTQPEVLTIPESPFDNEISLLYKVAVSLRQPRRYIIVRPATEADVGVVPIIRGLAFIPVHDLMALILQQPPENPDINPLLDIYQILNEISPDFKITPNDVAMFYYELQLEHGRTAEQIFPVVRQFYDNLEAEAVRNFEKEHKHQTAPQLSLGFRDVREMTDQYVFWHSQFEQYLNQDAQTLAVIEEIQSILESRQPVRASPLTIENVTISMSPTLTETQRPVNGDDGIDLFNLSQPSETTPLIQYNERGTTPSSESENRYYKLYRGEVTYPTPNYEELIPPATAAALAPAMYLTVWAPETLHPRVTKSDRRLPKDAFTRAVYLLQNNTLTVSSPITPTQTENIIRDRLSAALPMISLGPSHEIKVRGTFYLYNFEISEVSLLDMILNDPLMNTYLYVEESMYSYAEKKRLYIHYKSLLSTLESRQGEEKGETSNMSSVSAKLKQLYVESGSQFVEITPNGPAQIDLAPGTPYVQVRVTRADSREVAAQFMEIFRRLLDYYREKRQELDTFYRAFIPEIASIPPQVKLGRIPKDVPTPRQLPPEVPRHVETLEEIEEETREIEEVPDSTSIPESPGSQDLTAQPTVTLPNRRGSGKLQQLQNYAPDVFVSGVARHGCQSKAQVVPVPENEIENRNGMLIWRDHPFQRGDQLIDRQVLSFPPENPRYYFACPTDELPYPGVKKNAINSNATAYPFIPCCYGRNQMAPNVNSGYNQYYRGRRREAVATTSRVTNRLRTDKVLDPGKAANVPMAINTLLRQYSEESKDFVRFGVPRTLNSLIHCVCLALDIPEYVRFSVEGRENYVIRVRQHILATISPSLLRQELYDFPDEEIMRQLADRTIFFDPRLYYRAVEETFNVNLYVLTPAENGAGQLELPRFKIFHARPLRLDRPTVLIFKHSGARTSTLPYPQCELLVDYDSGTNTVRQLFGPSMTQLMHTALLTINMTMSWAIESTELVARRNLFSIINYNSLLPEGLSLSGQVLDDYGKLRALIGSTPSGKTLSIILFPSQPENLPAIPQPDNSDVELAVATYGQPIAVSRGSPNVVSPAPSEPNDVVTGLWYPLLDLTTGLYVPISPTSLPELMDLPIGPPNPLSPSSGESVVARVRRLRRTLDRILQLVRWLFSLSQVTTERPPSPRQFVEEYFAIGEETTDSATYYDLSTVPRRLPEARSVEEAITQMEQIVPTLFSQGRIIMYSPEFAAKILGKLEEFYRQARPLPHEPGWVVPTQITGYYQEETDFLPQVNVAIFLSEADIRSWLRSITRAGVQYLVISNHLDLSMALVEDPYLYIAPDGKIYLIQNVFAGEKNRALQVALTWSQNYVNLGFRAPPYNDGPLPYVIYGISTAAAPIAIENLTGGVTPYLQLLNTATQSEAGRYAAMLPLL
jgi:hypothetical protein